MAPRPGRITGGRLSGLVLLACAGVLTAGCTFERRPAAAESGDGQEVIVGEPGESPDAFLQRLQQARREGPREEIRALLHPDARLLRNGSVLLLDPGPDSAAGAGSVLTGPGGGGGVEPVRVEAAQLGDAALYVLRYSDRVETLLLARDSIGWRLRFLHQVSGPPDG